MTPAEAAVCMDLLLSCKSEGVALTREQVARMLAVEKLSEADLKEIAQALLIAWLGAPEAAGDRLRHLSHIFKAPVPLSALQGVERRTSEDA